MPSTSGAVLTALYHVPRSHTQHAMGSSYWTAFFEHASGSLRLTMILIRCSGQLTQPLHLIRITSAAVVDLSSVAVPNRVGHCRTHYASRESLRHPRKGAHVTSRTPTNRVL